LEVRRRHIHDPVRLLSILGLNPVLSLDPVTNQKYNVKKLDLALLWSVWKINAGVAERAEEAKSKWLESELEIS
jgi:hypothetical protein